ncbi:hypothetical protein [Sulfobacillus thermotolerans]
MIEPGQPAPFNAFPWIVLGLLMVAWAYALWRLRHIPDLADRVGSIIADE